MFPFHSFRLAAFRALGFDAFFNGELHDIDQMVAEERLAFLVPQIVFDKKPPQLLKFLTHLLNRFGYMCVTSEWRKTATYENDHHGSRFRTHVLGPHILLTVAENPTEPLGGEMGPAPPTSWIVVDVSCDKLRERGSCILHETYFYKAVLPDEADAVEDALIREAREYMSCP
jgi:hypothetical protein